MTTITRENFTEAMRAAVAERGADFVFPQGRDAELDGWRNENGTCRYTNSETGEPACLIGMALAKLGVKVSAFEMAGASAVLDRWVVRDNTLLDAADVAQSAQDNGQPWGEALAEYERYLAERAFVRVREETAA